MVRVEHSMIGVAAASELRIAAEWQPGELVAVVRVRGEVDADGSRAVDHHLRTRIPPEARYVVVDLGRVDLLAAPAVRALIEHTDRMAKSGRLLLTVVSSPHVRRVLNVLQVAGKLRLYESLPLAIAACKGSAEPRNQHAEVLVKADSSVDESTLLRAEIFGLRAALRTRPVVARASGVIHERYHLPDAGSAFTVLKDSARRHNLRLYTLARALLNTPPPRGPVWFPGRTRRPAPSLSFVQLRPDERGNRSAVLGCLLDAASHYLRASAATVQLVEHPGDILRLELSSNIVPALADHLAGTEEPAPPRVRTARVIVADVAAEPRSAGRDVLVGAGIGATQSTPLCTAENRFLGVVVTYHAAPGLAPTRLQCAKLDHAASEVAAWLEWHDSTVVFDALEQLHHTATDAGAAPAE
jgi:anti-anti-sigma factor